MRIRFLAAGLLCADCLWGQAKRFSWQDLCFKNPGAPVCQGNDYAIKPKAQTKDAAPKSIVRNPSASIPGATRSSTATPSLIQVAAIDWRFADPFADALVGINVGGIAGSSLVRNLITLLGTKQGLPESEIQKIFDGMSDVDQVALSVRNEAGNSRVVAMITGHVADQALPAPEAGMKAVPVSGGAMLIGHADAVDQAMQRIAMKVPPSALMQSAAARQASSEFWVLGSAGLIGPQAVSAGVKQFSMTVWMRSRITTDVSIEFSAAPNATTLRTMQANLGSGATVEGNAIHVRAQMDADEAQQKAAELMTGPLGQSLGALIEAARYLPVRDKTAPKQAKPIIYGLDPAR